MYEGEVMRALVCSACAEVTNDDTGSRRACVMLGGHAECGGWAAPAAQAARSNCSHLVMLSRQRLRNLWRERFTISECLSTTDDRKHFPNVRAHHAHLP